LVSATIGAVVGILIAPDKGAITRKKLMNSSKKLADNLKIKLTGSMDDVKDFAESQKNKKEFYKNVHSESNPV